MGWGWGGERALQKGGLSPLAPESRKRGSHDRARMKWQFDSEDRSWLRNSAAQRKKTLKKTFPVSTSK